MGTAPYRKGQVLHSAFAAALELQIILNDPELPASFTPDLRNTLNDDLHARPQPLCKRTNKIRFMNLVKIISSNYADKDLIYTVLLNLKADNSGNIFSAVTNITQIDPTVFR